MARRKKTSPLEDWIDLAAMLPWWGGVLLALVSYVFLHGLAGAGPGAPLKPGDIGSMVIGGLISNFAYWGQFLVPAICLIGALVSFLRRKNRQSLLTNVAQSQAADSLEQVSWSEFELLVGEAFRLQGYRVTELGGAGADGGVDLILHKGNEKFFVQCKQWKAYKVSVMVVRELYGVMAAKGAAGGFVVTSGSFTSDAVAFAAGRNITLVDGTRLFSMIKQARRARGDAASAFRPVNVPANAPAKAPENVAVAQPLATLGCPKCGSVMEKRLARNGANAGNFFWGCTTYPKCRGARNIVN